MVIEVGDKVEMASLKPGKARERHRSVAQVFVKN